jgi:AcrR family transcriptional regulator
LAATIRGVSFARVERTGCGKPPRDVAAATQLFRERGVEAVGLNELMKHAGFTQGGFYNHFESKADLVAEVLASAMAEGAAELAKSARAPVDESTTALRRYISYYLSRAHCDNIDLKKFGKADRRAILKIRSDDLHSDRQAGRAGPSASVFLWPKSLDDWHLDRGERVHASIPFHHPIYLGLDRVAAEQRHIE